MSEKTPLTREAFERGDYFSHDTGMHFERVKFRPSVMKPGCYGTISTAGENSHVCVVSDITDTEFTGYTYLFGKEVSVTVAFATCHMAPLQ